MSADAPAAKGAVRLENVTVSYGKERILHGISLDIAPGEFICLLGPSGCGKTTTLRTIAGLAAIDGGSILIDGRAAEALPAYRRGIGMVFQDLALFPHMTVHENISFGLKLRREDRATIQSKVADIVSLLRLAGLEERLPRQLSGGQQQRVALARSLVVNPSVLLLDEPFASLDRKLREEMRREIRALQRQLGITAVFVTHDQEEALTMSDRVVVMNRGRVEQEGAPADIYRQPNSRFVLDFVGLSNLLRISEVRRAGSEISFQVAGRTLRGRPGSVTGSAADGATALALRPERLRLSVDRENQSLANYVEATMKDISFEGALSTYEVELADGQRLLVREQNIGDREHEHRIGDRVIVQWRPEDGVFVH